MNQKTISRRPNSRRPVLIGAVLLSLLALSACAAGATSDDARDLPRVDRELQNILGGA